MPHPRYRSIDALRGFAVMGILLMNITGFALPSGAYFNPRATGAPSPADLFAWAAAFVFVDGKMRALFSILFGASLAIVVDRAAADGRDPVRVHLARMMVLALFGALHGVLLWPGDILLHYAIVGVAALPLTTLPPRRLARLALLLLLGGMALQATLLVDDIALRAAAHTPGAAAETMRLWHDLAAGIGIGRPADVAREIATRQGPWIGLVAANARDMADGAPALLLVDGPETLAYMAFGVAALRSGFLRGAWSPARYRMWALATLGPGLAASALLAAVAARSGFDTVTTFAAATLGGAPLRPVIAIGYAAVFLAAGGGSARLAAVGRVALSNYLATSFVMCALFDGWGAGLFAHIHRAALYAFVPPVWLAMLAWSPAWTRRFAYGPLEWIWRSASRAAVQLIGNPIETR